VVTPLAVSKGTILLQSVKTTPSLPNDTTRVRPAHQRIVEHDLRARERPMGGFALGDFAGPHDAPVARGDDLQHTTPGGRIRHAYPRPCAEAPEAVPPASVGESPHGVQVNSAVVPERTRPQSKKQRALAISHWFEQASITYR
jgi:hypothetical protein